VSAHPEISDLAEPVSVLAGVGPARARALERAGVRTLRDLVCLVPRRASEAAAELTIAAARERGPGPVTLRGTITRVALQRFGGRSTLRLTLADETGELPVLFFNQPWLRKTLAVGSAVQFSGRLGGARTLALVSPRIGTAEKPLAAAGTVELDYPAVEGLSSAALGRLARSSAARLAHQLADPLPEEFRARHALCALGEAAARVHAPADAAEFERARRRLALEPLLRLQARLAERRRERRAGDALLVPFDEAAHAARCARFPFALTAGQQRIAREIAADLARPRPMRRLLQGDVGTGKTVLGVYAALCVAGAGAQTAFLAPTELLAEQHFQGQRRALAEAGLHAVLLTGALAAGERRTVLAQLASGMADVVFGTHALFSADVRYRRLALCVIDEQQRFGVAQRGELIDKGRDAHVLLMTATPIPRTLALTLYGDLDTSVLRERPAGRGSVRTRWVRGADRRRVPQFLAERLAAGERVYWVVPRIEAADEVLDEDGRSSGELASAERAFEKLSATPLARHGIELVHGRLESAERAARLERFRSGAVQLLVATTVIEVGVDVPEATVMVIENAERLGLAQLHQLRGRIGRGARDGWCLLFGAAAAAGRFEVLERTHDGFEIAEEDLKRRGMGDLAGLRQAGENSEGLAELELDLLLAARELMEAEPALAARYAVEGVAAPAP